MNKFEPDVYSITSYQFDLPRELIAQYPVNQGINAGCW